MLKRLPLDGGFVLPSPPVRRIVRSVAVCGSERLKILRSIALILLLAFPVAVQAEADHEKMKR